MISTVDRICFARGSVMNDEVRERERERERDRPCCEVQQEKLMCWGEKEVCSSDVDNDGLNHTAAMVNQHQCAKDFDGFWNRFVPEDVHRAFNSTLHYTWGSCQAGPAEEWEKYDCDNRR